MKRWEGDLGLIEMMFDYLTLENIARMTMEEIDSLPMPQWLEEDQWNPELMLFLTCISHTSLRAPTSQVATGNVPQVYQIEAGV